MSKMSLLIDMQICECADVRIRREANIFKFSDFQIFKLK